MQLGSMFISNCSNTLNNIDKKNQRDAAWKYVYL